MCPDCLGKAFDAHGLAAEVVPDLGCLLAIPCRDVVDLANRLRSLPAMGQVLHGIGNRRLIVIPVLLSTMFGIGCLVVSYSVFHQSFLVDGIEVFRFIRDLSG